MKKQRICLGMLVIAVVVSGCSGKPGIPKIELSTASFDLGDITLNDGKRVETFVISNTGGAPLIITAVSTSCGCTKAEVDAQEIPPGKHTKLTVTYDPTVHPDLVGKFKRIVYVQSNDPVQAEVELELTGNTLPTSTP